LQRQKFNGQVAHKITGLFYLPENLLLISKCVVSSDAHIQPIGLLTALGFLI
jgi:hypothetical protein